MRDRAPSFAGRLLAYAGDLVLRLRTPMFVVFALASLVTFAWTSWRAVETARDNATIQAIAGGADVAIDPKRSSGEVIVARSRYLLDRDRGEDAQTLLDAASTHMAPEPLSRLLYNHANWRVRAAMSAIEGGALDKAIPLTKLAKDDYRRALSLKADFWDAKFNFDVAMRLVRDLPGYEQEGEEAPPDAKTRLWTDLPGVPRGLP